jgi:small redox-active disulfide protein 2
MGDNNSNGRTLLAVFAHPDDESNAAGGTLARYARQGASVTIVSATRGEVGIAGLGPDAAGAVRERELRAAATALGARAVRFLDYLDGTLPRADEGAAVAKLGALLRELEPQVILTFGPDGVSGHPDHIAISRWVTTAFEESNIPQKLYYILPSKATQQACGVPPPRELVGGPVAAIDVEQDLEAKAQAMQTHVSQTPPRVDASTLECHEYFRLARSRLGEMQDETDLFKGISPHPPFVVKILGIGCARCHALENEAHIAIQRLGLSARVERVENDDELKCYGLVALPGLVIGEQLVCAGRVPSRSELANLLYTGAQS